MTNFAHGDYANPLALSQTLDDTEVGNFTVDSEPSGWPTAEDDTYIVGTLDRGTNSEERVLLQWSTGQTFILSQRNYGGTGGTGKPHAVGGTLEHTLAAAELEEYDTHRGVATEVHGLAAGESFAVVERTQTLRQKQFVNSTFDGDAPNTFVNVPQTAVTDLVNRLDALEAGLGKATPVGTILMWSTDSFVPAGYLLCDGTAVDQGTYPDLYALLLAPFGGSTPDLTSRFPRGADGNLGQFLGEDSSTLSAANLPAHAHTMNHNHPTVESTENTKLQWRVNSQIETDKTKWGSVAVAGKTAGVEVRDASSFLNHTHDTNVPDFSGSTGSVGSGSSFSNIPSSVSVYFIIKALPDA